ncbi:MAG: ribosome biogenesis GTPase Der [bacterium]
MAYKDLPKVMIFGRPNVGKSALFNRLLGGRTAIVADTPGVTRDSLHGICRRWEKPFVLIDTGGFVSGKKMELEEAIDRQINRSLHTADVVLFVVDVSTGILPEDERIGDILRSEMKPIIIVANKADNNRLAGGAAEFYKLGLGEPVAVSAAHNSGIDDLGEKIAGILTETALPETESAEPVRFCIVGRSNVGKSSLVNAVLGEERCVVSEEAGTTRDSVNTLFHYKGQEYEIVDTAGIRKRKSGLVGVDFYSYTRACKSIKNSTVSVLLIDAAAGLLEGDKKIARYIKDSGKGLVIGVNKMDLIENPNKEGFIEYLMGEANFLAFTPVAFLSALTGEGVSGMLEEISDVSGRMGAELPQAMLEEVIFRFVDMRPPRSKKGLDGKVKGVEQIGGFPPKVMLKVKRKDCFSDGYLEMIEKYLIETYEMYGVPVKVIVREIGKRNKDSIKWNHR